MISGTTTTGFLATANKSIVLHDLLPRNENREEPNKAKVQLPNVVASNEEGGLPRRRRRRDEEEGRNVRSGTAKKPFQ